MRLSYRLLLLGCVASVLMSGCESSSYSSSVGATTVAATGTTTVTAPPPGFRSPTTLSGTHDQIVATAATASVAVVVGASETLSITFTSTDGMTMTGFSLSASGALPAGWSGPGSFVCGTVNIGSGCVLNLVYAPMAVDSGTFTVGYVVVDNSGLARTEGSIKIAYAATPSNNVIANAAPTGEVDAAVGGGSAAVRVNFITDDGNPATNLNVTSDLSALPAGWASAIPSAACAIVSTGSGCQLALTYTASAGDGGVLTLDYSYTDDSNTVKTGSLNIPYRSTSANDVIATASPDGQVLAVQKTGTQVVPITFTTDDGKPASQLKVTTNLAKLPPGWSAASPSFACAGVSSGNGCQLPLKYAPTALGSGTLALGYSYTDEAGTAKSGLLNIPYTATTNDNVVGTPSPAGQITEVVGLPGGPSSVPVTVTFTSDDGRPATALALTSSLTALPAGWSSSVAAFACSAIDTDTVCALPLTYSPTTAGSGSLALAYSYINNAGQTKTGTLSIAYRSTTDDSIIGTPSQAALMVRTGSATNVTVTFATNDGNPAGQLSLTGPATLPTGWSGAAAGFNCTTVSAGTACILSLTYTPTGADAGSLSLDFSYTNDAGIAQSGSALIGYSAVTPYLYVANGGANDLSVCPINADNSLASCSTTGLGLAGPAGIAVNGSYAYVANASGTSISQCPFDADGAVSGCAATGGTFASPASIAISPAGTFAYVSQSAGLDVCNVGAGGMLSGCAATGTTFNPLTGVALAVDGAHAYSVHGGNAIDVCSIATDGTLSTCAATGSNASQAVAALAIQNGKLYVSNAAGSLYVCPVNADATLGVCQTTAMGTNAGALAFIGNTAYLSTASAVMACAVNGDGTLSGCVASNDPTFNGTAGLAVR